MARMRPPPWLLAAAVTTMAAASHASSGVPCRFYGINAGAPIWNGTIIVDNAFSQQMAASGAHAARIDFLLDGSSQWDGAALGKYDSIIDSVLASGIEPLGLMNYGAVVGGQAQWNDDPDQDGYNAYVDSFASASQILIEHFANRIKRWELWNEPSCWSNPDWATNPQNAGCTYLLPRVFAKLMAEVYVRNETTLASQQISLVSGGLFAHDIGGSLTTGVDYMSEVYAQGVWDWMESNKQRRYAWDFIGYHIYVEQGGATDGSKLAAYAEDMRQLATQNNDPAAFSITEIGWTTAAVSEDVQAANLSTTFATFEARSDVDQVFWFSMRDAPGAGLDFGIRDGNGAPKKAVDAFLAASAGCTGGAQADAGTDATSADVEPGPDSPYVPDGAPNDSALQADHAATDGAIAKDVALGDAAGSDAPRDGAAGLAPFGKTTADDGGCACRTRAPSNDRNVGWWVAFAAGVLVARGRRRATTPTAPA